ncbi:MAG: protein-methionine-sulfoxide reductase heme-binding subunit MsrQ [Acidobacteriaceae bacterium]
MPTRWIPYVKAAVHLLCLLPVLHLLRMYRSGAMGLMADPVRYITHQTGDWALYLLLNSLAVTPIRRLSPRLSNLIRFRRMLGVYAFFYATLHLATYVFLFSGYDLPTVVAGMRAGHPGVTVDAWKAVWPTIQDDIAKRRFIQVGFIGWLILLALALTSPSFIMRRMGGKPWQTLHRLVYAAAALGIIHFWWLVKTGNREPLPITIVLGILLAARLWKPTRRPAAPERPTITPSSAQQTR